MANKKGCDPLKVGLYPFADILDDDYQTYTQMLSGKFKRISPNADLQLVIGDKFDPYAPCLDEYLGADGFDILEMDMVRKKDLIGKVVEVQLEPYRYLEPAVVAVDNEGCHIAYPTICCGNYIMEVKRRGEYAVSMGDKDYTEFEYSASIAEETMVEPNKSHYSRLLGGKLDDSDGWYLPFIYLDGYIDIHGKDSVQAGIEGVLAGQPDIVLILRLQEFFSLFPKTPKSTADTIADIVNGKTAYFYGFSEILGKILDASNGSLKAFGALSPTMGKEKLVLVYTDAIVINKTRFEHSSQEKKKLIQEFIQFFTSVGIREDLVLGRDMNPPQIRYLLPPIVEFYQNTDNIVYTEIYDMVKNGVPSPTLSEETRKQMEKVLHEILFPTKLNES